MIPLFADAIQGLLDTFRLLLKVFVHVDFKHPVSNVSQTPRLQSYMTSSIAVRDILASSPMTLMATSTSFHACTKEAAVACKKISSEMTLACESRGVMYSPICCQPAFVVAAESRLTTSLATLSQKDKRTRAEGGNTCAAVSASARNASRT